MEYLFCTYYWAVCEEQLGERPFLIYRSMVRSGYSPNEHIFQMLISAFYKNEDFDGDVQVLRDMLGRLMSPDLSTMSELCDGLCRCGKNQLALALCSEMEVRRLLPDGFDKEKIAITHPENETSN